MIGTGALSAALVALTAEGVLAVQFAISGIPFTVTADRLDGTGFAQWAELDHMAEGSPNEGDTGGQVVVIVSAIDQAELTNLCQSINMGGINMKITAGDTGTPVTARTLVVDSDDIAGNADFKNIEIGRDASTLDKVPGQRGLIGIFGQQADEVVITDLRQNNYATTAAAFTLPHLRMRFSSDGC
ncbi:MAG TPA: DUF6230 family protein [Micromonosporaceae bacterium]